jgi:hypothetical protein
LTVTKYNYVVMFSNDLMTIITMIKLIVMWNGIKSLTTLVLTKQTNLELIVSLADVNKTKPIMH